MFFANRSRSVFSTCCLRFMAPGLCRSVFCLITFTWLSGSSSPVSVSGRASASDSRFVASFLDARRHFGVFWEVFSILETKLACLIARLSFLEERESSPREAGLEEATAPFPLAGLFAETCFLMDWTGA